MRCLVPLLALSLSLLVSGHIQAGVVHASFSDLPDAATFDGFVDLNRSGMGGGDQTTATNALVNGFGSNFAGSGDATIQRTSGSIYPAGSGMYGAGTFQVFDTTLPENVSGLVFQIILNDFNADAVVSLSYNGGSQNLAPTLETFTNTGWVADYYRFSWDLSGLEPITSYNVTVTGGFMQVLAVQANAVDAVPEPGAVAALGLAGAGLLLRRRRKRVEA